MFRRSRIPDDASCRPVIVQAAIGAGVCPPPACRFGFGFPRAAIRVKGHLCLDPWQFHCMKSPIRYVLAVLCLLGSFGSWADDALETGFRNPPPSARPCRLVPPRWQPEPRGDHTRSRSDAAGRDRGSALHGDRSARPRVQRAFAGPLWREPFKHINAEAARLGLQVNVNNDAGWCGSGGPWITPEL